MRKAARKAVQQAGAAPSKKRDESKYNKETVRMRLVTEDVFFARCTCPAEETNHLATCPAFERHQRDTRGWFFWKDIVREVDGKKERCRGIFARYPDGSAAHLPVRPVPEPLKDVNGGHSWAWDGNETSPTLTPSVHIFGAWHGWIRSGVMVSC